MKVRRRESAAARKHSAEPANFPPLSPRQQQVADYLRTGTTPKEIASKLDISAPTVGKHMFMLRVKTGSRTLYQALCRIQQAATA